METPGTFEQSQLTASSRGERPTGAQEPPARGTFPPLPAPGTINGLAWGEYLAREYAASKRIALYEMGGGKPFCGLIVPAPSGFHWRQQTSGLMCTQRELEGLYLPIPDADLAQELEALHPGCSLDTLDDREASAAYVAAHPDETARNRAWMREHHPELAALQERLASEDRPLGLAREEADSIDRLLRAACLPLAVDVDRLARSTEAWVWVVVAGDVARWEPEFRPVPDATVLGGTRYQRVGFRFASSFAALAGSSAVMTWPNCD
jgi:hypothetical protein